MQILGGLLSLPVGESPSLPLPWWHRSPLGLLNNTSVFIAIVRTPGRPVGDVIVAVLDPAKWEQMIKIECQHPDGPGAIANVLELVLPLNIAVAETVTVEYCDKEMNHDKHKITLICEPRQKGSTNVSDEIAFINSSLEEGNLEGHVSRYLSADIDLVWRGQSTVDHGWILSHDLFSEIRANFSDNLHRADLTKVVVSADTESRVLRYVFPLKGAFSIEIEHSDIEGALLAILSVFKDNKLNVLSAYLRRGGAMPNNAILKAICEPTNDTDYSILTKTIEQSLRKLNIAFGTKRPKFSQGESAHKTIYPKHPEDVVIRAPEKLSWLVRKCKNEYAPKGTAIFFSRRFTHDPAYERIANAVSTHLKTKGCHPVQVHPKDSEFGDVSFPEISARLWASKAGIVLVANIENQKSDKKEESFNVNLAHEIGFLQGQSKKILLLVEEGYYQELEKWSNARGVVRQEFSRVEHSPAENALETIIDCWLSALDKKI